MQLNSHRKYVMKRYSIVHKLEINCQKFIQASARRRLEKIFWEKNQLVNGKNRKFRTKHELTN